MVNFYYFISKSLKIFSWKIFLLLMLGCIGMMPVEAQLGTNLIVNGDAETPPVVFALGPWSVSGTDMGHFTYPDNGVWYVPDTSAYVQAQTGHGAHGGSYLFNAGNTLFPGGSTTLTQTIALPAGLLAQDLVFSFSSFVSTDGYVDPVNADLIEIKVDYVNHVGLNAISWDTAWIAEGPFDFAWHNLTNTQNILIADNIESIVITLTATNNNTSAPLTALFDDLSLVAGTPLPISLLNFTAAQRSDHTVGLQWQTGQEENSHYIEVQRSGDGQHFASIGQVPAAGSSQLVRSYSFTDASPLSGNNFYRLKLVDLDGSFKYSKVLDIRPTVSGKTIEVFSNPFHDQIGMRIAAAVPDRLVLSLMDATGRTCLRQSVNTQSGNNFINLYPSAGMASGVYFLHIQGSHTDQTIRVLKQ